MARINMPGTKRINDLPLLSPLDGSELLAVEVGVPSTTQSTSVQDVADLAGRKFLEESKDTSVVNLSAIGSEDNLSVAIIPKGEGAFYLTNSAGVRGAYAVDLQLEKNQAYQIASGKNSVIAGGSYNLVSSLAGVVLGGTRNQVHGDKGVVSGGQWNSVNSQEAVVCGGSFNSVNANNSTVAGGHTNRVEESYSFIGSGQSNKIYSRYSTIGGGYQNSTEGIYASVPGGYKNLAKGNYSLAIGSNAEAFNQTELALGAGAFTGNGYGQAQSSRIVVLGETYFYMPDDCFWLVEGKLIATSDTGLVKAWEFTGIFNSKNSSISLNFIKPATELGDSQLDWELTFNTSTNNRIIARVRSNSEPTLDIRSVLQLDILQIK